MPIAVKKPKGKGLNKYERQANYYQQNGAEKLTPKQRRRIKHKEGRRSGLLKSQ